MNKGFTLIEILIVAGLVVIILTAAIGVYLMGQKAYRVANVDAELIQNSRVVLDRLSREIRQTNEIVTQLSSPEIEFQDGHTDALRYIRYFLDNTDLRRQIITYYFAFDPETPVRWDATDIDGNPSLQRIDEDKLQAEYFINLNFSENGVINIEMTLNKGDQTNNLATAVYGRNTK